MADGYSQFDDWPWTDGGGRDLPEVIWAAEFSNDTPLRQGQSRPIDLIPAVVFSEVRRTFALSKPRMAGRLQRINYLQWVTRFLDAFSQTKLSG